MKTREGLVAKLVLIGLGWRRNRSARLQMVVTAGACALTWGGVLGSKGGNKAGIPGIVASPSGR